MSGDQTQPIQPRCVWVVMRVDHEDLDHPRRGPAERVDVGEGVIAVGGSHGVRDAVSIVCFQETQENARIIMDELQAERIRWEGLRDRWVADNPPPMWDWIVNPSPNDPEILERTRAIKAREATWQAFIASPQAQMKDPPDPRSIWSRPDRSTWARYHTEEVLEDPWSCPRSQLARVPSNVSCPHGKDRAACGACARLLEEARVAVPDAIRSTFDTPVELAAPGEVRCPHPDCRHPWVDHAWPGDSWTCVTNNRRCRGVPGEPPCNCPLDRRASVAAPSAGDITRRPQNVAFRPERVFVSPPVPAQPPSQWVATSAGSVTTRPVVCNPCMSCGHAQADHETIGPLGLTDLGGCLFETIEDLPCDCTEYIEGQG